MTTPVYPFCSRGVSGLGLCCHQHLCADRLVSICVHFYPAVEWLGHRPCTHSALVDNCQIVYRVVVAIDAPTETGNYRQSGKWPRWRGIKAETITKPEEVTLVAE